MSDVLTPTALLQDLWSASDAAALAASPLDLLRYRSNRLGDDLRITNFGGGNTSSKFELSDPLTGSPARVMAVKGSGGDLRSIGTSGFALLYLDKLEQLIERYRGEAHEDEMVALYPLCAFGENRVAASIDTPLHAFLPFPHVDHLHPDWAIALAASANGDTRLAEFNARYGRSIVWVPWQRPGFELALMLRRAVDENPGCDGILLGGHGLFTWGQTQRDCYMSSIRTIDQMGQFVSAHARAAGRPLFGGPVVTTAVVEGTAADVLPYLRGVVSTNRRTIAHWDHSEDALAFANSAWADDLVLDSARAAPITSCARASVRCSCPGNRPTDSTRCGRESTSGLRAIATITLPTIRHMHCLTRRRCATPTHRSWSSPGWESSASRKTNVKRASPPSSSSTRST